MNLDEFEAELKNVEFVNLIGPVDRASIALAEHNLEITLPMQYQAFVERFGGGGVGPESIIGLGGPDHLNFEFMTKLLRSRNPDTFPTTLIPIRNDGYGNYDCIDLESVNSTSGNSVIEWSHDGGRGRQLANDFAEWLGQFLSIVMESQ